MFREVVVDAGEVPDAEVLAVVVPAPAFPEAELGDTIQVECPELTANLGIVGAFVHVAGGFTFRLINPTAVAIDPASLTYDVTLTKKGPTL